MGSVWRFGEFQLEPDRRLLSVQARQVDIGARALDLLVLLIENRSRVVTKKETLSVVWDGLEVQEGNLYVQIASLRKLLGSSAICTVASRGYRFVADVDEHRPSAPGAHDFVAASMGAPKAAQSEMSHHP